MTGGEPPTVAHVGSTTLPAGDPTVTTTYDLTHSAECWRWHHQCAAARIRDLAAALTATRIALTEAVAQFDRAVTVDRRRYFDAEPISEDRYDRWQRALDWSRDVAGADVTPDPAAPATTT